jgi:hypothetical protein
MTQSPAQSLRTVASLPSLRAIFRSIAAAMKWRRRTPPPPLVVHSTPAPESDFKLELERRLLGQ